MGREHIMPSEKSRYLNRGPSAPLGMNQLKQYLKRFSHERLVEMVWLNAQSNSILWKALSSSIAIQESHGDFEKVKQAIDFAFYFPDTVHYSERGYGTLIYEMTNALEVLYKEIGEQFALQTAHYIYEEGQKALEYFDEGWDWICALDNLKSWIKNNSTDNHCHNKNEYMD